MCYPQFAHFAVWHRGAHEADMCQAHDFGLSHLDFLMMQIGGLNTGNELKLVAGLGIDRKGKRISPLATYARSP